jgi:monovalent cation:H+ antiporter, CPA1 family
LSIALALSLPTTLPGRAQLIAMTFGAVMFSLLAQGLTIKPLIRRLGLAQQAEQTDVYELLQGELLAETAAAAELEQMHGQGLITKRIYHALKPQLDDAHESLIQQLAQFDGTASAFEQQQQQRLHEHLVNVKKARLLALRRDGLLSENAYQRISEKLSEEIAPRHEGEAKATSHKVS